MYNRTTTFRWAVVYLSISQNIRLGTLGALRRLADIFILYEDDETALCLFHTALQGATASDIYGLNAEAMVGIMLRRGDSVHVRSGWQPPTHCLSGARRSRMLPQLKNG